MTPRRDGAASAVALACVLTFLHSMGVQMRVPIVPLYARAHGAGPTDVGIIVGAQMAVAALAAIPLGRASDHWGRRFIALGGMAASAITSFAVPLVEAPLPLAVVYACSGIGVAAFAPAVMSLIGDVAPPGTVARAFAWYTTALYTAFGVGPIVGGYAADAWGDRASFVAAGVVVVAALLLGPRLPSGRSHAAAVTAPLSEVRGNRQVWSAWVAVTAGLVPWGAMMTFFPLLSTERGLPPSFIGLVFGTQAFVNTAARVPAGRLIDASRTRRPWVVGGLLGMAATTVPIPFLAGRAELMLITVAFGVFNAVAFIALNTILSEATTPATRGVAMGGFATAIYGGLFVGSFGLGPVVSAAGYAAAFVLASAAAVVGAVVSAVVSASPRARD